MEEFTDIVQQELIRLLPQSIIENIACFVFYDNHPRDGKLIDIIVCTKNGELREYFKRDMLSSIKLNASSALNEILIMRNGDLQLFYVVGSKDELFIVSSKETLKVHTKMINIEKYTVEDSSCIGQKYLKVTRKDDAVPIIFDQNFNSGDVFSKAPKSESLPLISDLKKKFIEAQYSVQNHEKTISDYVKLRQVATLCANRNIHPNHDNSIYKCISNAYGVLKVKTEKPWIKICNGKVIIALQVCNEYKEPIEDIHMIISCPAINSLSYTSKLFKKGESLPFWEEQNRTLLPNCETTVIGVIKLDDIKPYATSRIVISGAVSYKTEKTYVLPFEDVCISSIETYGDEFDALSSVEFDANTILAILSTTEQTDLRIRLIKSDGNLIHLITKHLQMERVGHNVAVYRKSPYHALNGILLHFTAGTDKSAYMSAYTRTKTQLQALIHSIHDAVPAKIIITPPNYIISAKTSELAEFSEQEPEIPEVDYLGYAETVLNRTGIILEYLDQSIVKMGESKNPEVVNKIGTHIDMYACGQTEYETFRKKMILETSKGVECLEKENIGLKSNPESMNVDQ